METCNIQITDDSFEKAQPVNLKHLIRIKNSLALKPTESRANFTVKKTLSQI